jgi:hypothetical protein
LYNEKDEQKLEILKELDPYDKSKIGEKTQNLKWGNPNEAKTLKNLVDVNKRESENEVKWDFEHVGVLFEKGAIPKEEFLKAYWRIVIICWIVLKKRIVEKRQKHGQDYMMLFEKLFEAADKYRSKHSQEKIDTEQIKKDYNE